MTWLGERGELGVGDMGVNARGSSTTLELNADLGLPRETYLRTTRPSSPPPHTTDWSG